MTLALIVGLWTTTCIQTQIAGNNDGFAIESYEISEAGTFEFSRQWFEDAKCTDAKATDLEIGTLKIGSKMTGMFITGDTFEADFTTSAGKDLGAISLKDAKTLKVGRGLKGSNFRNTMLGVFDFKKM